MLIPLSNFNSTTPTFSSVDNILLFLSSFCSSAVYAYFADKLKHESQEVMNLWKIQITLHMQNTYEDNGQDWQADAACYV